MRPINWLNTPKYGLASGDICSGTCTIGVMIAAAFPRLSTELTKSHSRIDLEAPPQWVIYGSHFDGHVRRLIVFVHGFLGKAVGTWLDFPEIDTGRPENQWWVESDLLFVGYKSTKDDITGVANRIRQQLSRFYPLPPQDALTVAGNPVRADLMSPYEELILVGHTGGD